MTRRRRPVGLLESGNGLENLADLEDSDIIDVELVDTGDVQPSPKVRRPPILKKEQRPLDFSSPPHDITTVDIAEETIIPLHSGRRLREDLVPVPCPLYPAIEPSPENPAGVKQLVVWFKTNGILAAYGRVKSLPEMKLLLDDPMILLTKIRQVARRFENWNLLDDDGQPVPAPTPGEPETYKILLEDLDFALWVIGDGFFQAFGKGQTKNLESDSTQ